MSYHVYVLWNAAAQRRYIGQTDDLPRRLALHNGELAVQHPSARRFTAKFPGPWVLIHTEERSSRADAMRRERWLKSGVGRQWLDAQVGRAGPPRAD